MPEGTDDVAVNTPIATILSDGEDAAALKDGKRRGAQTAGAAAGEDPANGVRGPDDAALGQVPLNELREAQKSRRLSRRRPELECRQAPRCSP